MLGDNQQRVIRLCAATPQAAALLEHVLPNLNAIGWQACI